MAPLSPLGSRPLYTSPLGAIAYSCGLGGELRIAIFHGEYWSYLGPGASYHTKLPPERWCEIPRLADGTKP
jgi:hypothetical protein